MAWLLKCIDFSTLNGSKWCICNREACIILKVKLNMLGFKIYLTFIKEGRLLKCSNIK